MTQHRNQKFCIWQNSSLIKMALLLAARSPKQMLGTFTLKIGDAIIMPADEPHAVKAITRFQMLLTMIRK